MTATSRRREAERRQKAAELRKAEAARQRRRRQIIVSAAVVGVLIVVGVVAFLVQNSGKSSGPVATPASTTVGKGTGGFVVGKASAPVTLQEFEDFQCPICGELEKSTGATIRQLTDSGKLKVDYHMLSFIDDNYNGKTTYSKRSANAAACVQQYAPADWRAFHDLLYANQPSEGTAGPTNAQLIADATKVGATSPQIATCINNQTYKKYVAKVEDDSSKAGVTGTPSLYLNGSNTALTGAGGSPVLTPAEFTAAVDAAAKKATAK